jgi:hypothetical protein
MSRLLSELVAATIAGIVLVVVGLSGATAALGAHPWWAAKVVWIGLAFGLGLGLGAAALGAGWRLRAIAGAAALGCAGLAAVLGKAVFAASYAENALAGRFWYLGWIGLATAAALLLSALVVPVAVSALRR